MAPFLMNFLSHLLVNVSLTAAADEAELTDPRPNKSAGIVP